MGTDDWMFGGAKLPGMKSEEKTAPPDAKKDKKDKEEERPAAPPPAAPAESAILDELLAAVGPAVLKKEPPAPAPVPPPKVAPASLPPLPPPPPALSEADLHKQRVLEHSQRVRRALIEGKPIPGAAAPPAPPAPKAAPPPPAAAPSQESSQEPAPGTAVDDTAALRRALTGRAQRSTIDALAKKGVKRVNVLDMPTIEKIVAEAVERALERNTRHLSAAGRKQLEHEAKREFLELMEEHKRALAEKSDEERRRADLERQVAKLRGELARQEQALAEEREAPGVVISPESIAELETKVMAALGEFMTAERRALVHADDPKALAGIDKLEKKLADAFDHLIGRLKSGYEDLLERRISKLNQALAETEDALRRVAAMKVLDDGIASIYATIQGLGPDEINYARKKELLGVVFLENLELQKKEITDADRALARGTPSQAARMPSLESLPEGFTAPLDPLTTETAF
ncbi:hypothetical protein HY251_17295 [bacterium]|nr:hypothetical protein [bacterium]